MACGCHPNGEAKVMSKVIELYKGDSVTRVPEGSAAEAAFLADGFSRQKPVADVSDEASEGESDGGEVTRARSRGRQRSAER